jgi:hypothetical protein
MIMTLSLRLVDGFLRAMAPEMICHPRGTIDGLIIIKRAGRGSFGIYKQSQAQAELLNVSI